MIKLNRLDIEKDFLRLTLEDGSIQIKDRAFRLDNYIVSKKDMNISREVMDQYKEVMNEYDRILATEEDLAYIEMKAEMIKTAPKIKEVAKQTKQTNKQNMGLITADSNYNYSKHYYLDFDGNKVRNYKDFILYEPSSIIYIEDGKMKIIKFNQISHSWDFNYTKSKIELYKKDLIEIPTLKNCIYIKVIGREGWQYESLVVKSITKTLVGKTALYHYILEADKPYKPLEYTDPLFDNRDSFHLRRENN